MNHELPDFINAHAVTGAGWEQGATVFRDVNVDLTDYLLLAQPHQYYMYLCMLVTGAKNKAEPLLTVDPEVRSAMNQRGYFAVSLCDNILRQYKAVEDSLRRTKSSTFILCNEYNVQKADIKPRALSLSLRLTKGKLEAYADFGHCNLYPMLGYEIVGCVSTALSMADVLDTKLTSMSWLFHGLYNESVRSVPQQTFTIARPTYSEALDMLRMERALAAAPEIRPRCDRPLSTLEKKVLDALQEDYSARKSNGIVVSSH